MEKFVVGIIAVLCLHIGFVLYVGDDQPGNTARLGARNNVFDESPLFIYPPRTVSKTKETQDTIMIARGGEPEMEFDGTAQTAAVDLPMDLVTERVPRERLVDAKEPRSFAQNTRTVRSVRKSRNSNEPVYQNASYTVTRAEFRPGKTLVAPAVSPVFVDDRSSLMASSKKNKRGDRRSLLSKMSPIVKKPYDLLKAVGSWIR